MARMCFRSSQKKKKQLDFVRAVGSFQLHVEINGRFSYQNVYEQRKTSTSFSLFVHHITIPSHSVQVCQSIFPPKMEHFLYVFAKWTPGIHWWVFGHDLLVMCCRAKLPILAFCNVECCRCDLNTDHQESRYVWARDGRCDSRNLIVSRFSCVLHRFISSKFSCQAYTITFYGGARKFARMCSEHRRPHWHVRNKVWAALSQYKNRTMAVIRSKINEITRKLCVYVNCGSVVLKVKFSNGPLIFIPCRLNRDWRSFISVWMFVCMCVYVRE